MTHPCPVSVGSPFIRFRTPVGNQSGRSRSPGGCKQAGNLDFCRWKEIIYKENGCGRSKTDTTVISAATDEVQEHLIGEYVTAFAGTVNASAGKASVAVSFDMQYLEQKYTIQN